MEQPIKASRKKINQVKNSVVDTAEQVGKINDQLFDAYLGNLPHMGDSKDLRVTRERFEAALDDIKSLQTAIDDFADRLLRIRRLYQKAQENAIVRASRIPR